MLSPVIAYPFLAKNGHSSVGNSTLTAEIVLSPIVAYPFLAKIGHSSVGNSTLTAEIMLSLVVAYPFWVKNGHSSVEYSTLSADKVLAPIVVYPFLGPINLSPFRCIMWSGMSAIQTSVSHASLSEKDLNVLKSRKAVT